MCSQVMLGLMWLLESVTVEETTVDTAALWWGNQWIERAHNLHKLDKNYPCLEVLNFPCLEQEDTVEIARRLGTLLGAPSPELSVAFAQRNIYTKEQPPPIIVVLRSDADKEEWLRLVQLQPGLCANHLDNSCGPELLKINKHIIHDRISWRNKGYYRTMVEMSKLLNISTDDGITLN